MDPDFANQVTVVAEKLRDYILHNFRTEFIGKDGQVHPGWHQLPIICIKLLTCNTFFFTKFMENI